MKAEAVKADNEKWLNSLGRQSIKVDTTLAEDIQSAAVIEALEILDKAKQAIGLK